MKKLNEDTIKGRRCRASWAPPIKTEEEVSQESDERPDSVYGWDVLVSGLNDVSISDAISHLTCATQGRLVPPDLFRVEKKQRQVHLYYPNRRDGTENPSCISLTFVHVYVAADAIELVNSSIQGCHASWALQSSQSDTPSLPNSEHGWAVSVEGLPLERLATVEDVAELLRSVNAMLPAPTSVLLPLRGKGPATLYFDYSPDGTQPLTIYYHLPPRIPLSSNNFKYPNAPAHINHDSKASPCRFATIPRSGPPLHCPLGFFRNAI